MTNYAQIETKTCRIETEFGEDLARKWFGNEIVDSLPRFVRGPKKGKIKGFLSWQKIVKGGWVRGYQGEGYVETRVGWTINRQIHEYLSSQNGVYAGHVLFRESDNVEAKEKRKNRFLMEIDLEVRNLDCLRSIVENAIVSRTDFSDETIEILNSVVTDYTKQINEELKKIRS